MAGPDSVTTLNYESVRPPVQREWWQLPAIALLSLAAAMWMGAVTNFINGLICPGYFEHYVGQMYPYPMTVLHVVRQGLFESSFFGVTLMVVMTVSYLASTGLRWPLAPALKMLGFAILLTLICWLLGGLAGGWWTVAHPVSLLARLPEGSAVDLRRWGWVGGSIVGIYISGGLSIILLPMFIHRRYRQIRRAAHA